MVNRRAGSSKEEDIKLLSALSVVLCDAVNRAVELKDSWHSSTRTPLTQVEFFGETTIIPDKSARRKSNCNSLLPGQLHEMLNPGEGMSPGALNRGLDVLRDPSESAVGNYKGGTKVGRETAGADRRDSAVDHKTPDGAAVDAAVRVNWLLQPVQPAEPAFASTREETIDYIDGDDFPLEVRISHPPCCKWD